MYGKRYEVVDSLEVLPPLRWPKSAGPEPSRRAFSFLKLHIWNLTQFDRVLYFDPDVFWAGDASRYLARYGHAQFAAAEYTGDLVPEWWRLWRANFPLHQLWHRGAAPVTSSAYALVPAMVGP